MGDSRGCPINPMTSSTKSFTLVGFGDIEICIDILCPYPPQTWRQGIRQYKEGTRWVDLFELPAVGVGFLLSVTPQEACSFKA